jgi:nucleotide-binding universal stress UspA family protein
VSTIIIGVDESERSADAIAFGSRLANASGAVVVVVANAYPYSDTPSRASNAAYRDALREDALITVRNMRSKLEGLPEERSLIRITPDTSPAKALHHLAHAERAALAIVGSTHTGRAGRVVPGSTGERLLHGSPCSVAVVPKGYREHAREPMLRVGVAYNESDEAKAALASAASLALALGAELELIAVVSTEYFTTPALMDAEGSEAMRKKVEHHVQEHLDAALSSLPEGVTAHARRATGEPVELLAARSAELDVLVVGSRGYGPLHSVLTGGVSGRLVRSAQCPVILVPRGIEAPLESLFGGSAATVA